MSLSLVLCLYFIMMLRDDTSKDKVTDIHELRHFFCDENVNLSITNNEIIGCEN